MAFWDDFGDFFPPLLFRCKSQSFQLNHDHYQPERSPTWSSPSKATEGATDSLSSRQLAVMFQRHLMKNFLLLWSNNARLAARYAWTRFQKNRLRASILADTHFVGNAFVD